MRPWLVCAGVVVLLAAPSANLQWFDGLPFSQAHEFAVLVLVAAAAFSGCPSRVSDRPLASRATVWVAAALLAGLGLKLALVASGQFDGFTACARSRIGSQPARPCEASYENLFGRFGAATRIDERIQFEPDDWNFSFFNAERQSVPHWVLGNLDWRRRPIAVEWRGVIDPARGTTLLIEYAGEATVRLGPRLERLPPRYDALATARLPLSPGTQSFELHYAFDDGSRIGGEARGPYATLRVRVAGPNAVDGPLTASTATGLGRLAAWVVDLLAVAVLAHLLSGAFVALRGRRLITLALAALGAVAAFAAVTSRDWVLFGLPMIGVVFYALASHAERVKKARASSRLETSLVLAATACGAAAGMIGGLATVVYQEAGSDWLTYESLARSILETGSLEGGEAVFFYQPLWRYLLFLLRAMVGDGHLLFVAVGVAAMNWALIAFIEVAPPPQGRGKLRELGWTAGLALLVAMANSPTLWAFLRYPSSEYYTWVFLIAAFPLVFSRRRRWLGFVLVGACYLLRPNQALALAWMVVVAALFAVERSGLRHGLRSTLRHAAIVLVMGLLPLAHNLWYGGRPVVTTLSAGIPQNLRIDPWVAIQTAAAGAPDPILLRQLRFAVSWNWAEAKPASYVATDISVLDAFPVLAWAAQCVWLLAGVVCLRHRRTTPPHVAAALALPLMYLAVHLVYQVDIYYPRHVVAAHLGMLATGVYGFSRISTEATSGGPSVGRGRGGVRVRARHAVP